MAELLTTRQVQELLHVDRTTIYRLVASGQLSAIRVGKQWRFTRAVIESLLQHSPAPATVTATVTALTDSDDAPSFAAHVSSVGIQQLQDLFAELLGVMLVVTDMQGHPLTEPSNACSYYRTLMQDGGLGRLCDETWPRLAAALPLRPEFVRSQFGPLCARAFIRVDNTLEGMLVAGCVAPDTWPPADETLALAAKKVGIEREQIVSTSEAVYHLSSADRERVFNIIQCIADIISQMIADRWALVRRLREIGSLSPDGLGRL